MRGNERGSLADEPAGIGALLSRLLDEARDFVRAELLLGRRILLSRLSRAAIGLGLAVVALFLVQAGVVALLLGCVLALARLIGPLASGVVVALVALLVAGLLGLIAKSRIMGALAGDGATKP
jgi:hypothetical protein